MNMVEYKIKELKGDAILKLALCELLLNNTNINRQKKQDIFTQIATLQSNKVLAKVAIKLGLLKEPNNKYTNGTIGKYKKYADAFEVFIYDCYEINGLELVKIIVTKYLINDEAD